MTESHNYKQLIINVCLPLTAVSLIIFLGGFTNKSAERIALWASAIFSILGAVCLYLYTQLKIEKATKDEKERLKLESDILSKLHYNLHVINPELKLINKVTYALKLLTELFPEATFACYACENNDLAFVTAYKIQEKNEIKSLSQADPLVCEISSKLKSVTDYDYLMNNGMTSPLSFSNGVQIQGQIYPINLYTQIYGLLVVVKKEKLTTFENHLIEEFCKGLAVVIENHNLISNLTQKNCQNKSTAIKETNSEIDSIGESFFESMIPRALPSMPCWDLAKYFVSSPNRADFLDIIDTTSDKQMILFGKCSGRGISAAFYVNKLRLMIRCFIEDCPTPALLLNKLSKYLNSELMPDNFVDVTALLLSPIDSQVTLAIAGNTIPIINRTRNGFAEIPQLDTAIPLGLFNQGTEPYKDQYLNIMPGDGLILHTDGITDLPGKGLDRISNEKIKLILDKIPEASADEMLCKLVIEMIGKKSGYVPDEDHSIIYLKAE